MKKTFEINFKIYSQQLLLEAIGDFSDVGKIILQDNKLKISGEKENEIEEIFNELMNYVIGLSN